jgi:hypothetical protein
MFEDNPFINSKVMANYIYSEEKIKHLTCEGQGHLRVKVN